MLRLVLQLVALATLLSGSLAVTSVVIKPIRATGDEIGLILVPGASIKGEQYRKTAEAIQRASELRVWVALTGNFTLGIPNPLEMKDDVEGAIKKLRSAGMTSSNYVGVAHSLGGVFLSSYATSSPLKAIVLMGSYISRGTKLRDYPKPVLTLSGELDGQTRITRIAVDFEQLQEDARKNKSALYRTPVVSIKGSCHAQFASGPMPAEVKKYDLPPDITEEVAHAKIGKYVSHFLAAQFITVPSKLAVARKNLEIDFKESSVRFQPLLNIKSLDVSGKASPWALMSQARFAGQFVSRTRINNEILTNPGFLESKPSITKLGSGIAVNTTTLIEYVWNPADISTHKESPNEVDIKMKSTEAIQKALNSTTSNVFQDTAATNQTCRSLNELALELALKNSTAEAQQRYHKRGRPLTFSDDVVYGTGLQWSSTGLKMTEDDKGLHVQAIALVTSTSSPFFPGMHYCKVLSPYRAMEWINVDSLRSHKP